MFIRCATISDETNFSILKVLIKYFANALEYKLGDSIIIEDYGKSLRVKVRNLT